MTANDISMPLSTQEIPQDFRIKEVFHHIDMRFLNRRLCMTELLPEIRNEYFERVKPGSDYMTVLRNDHLLVTMLIDTCDILEAPTLFEAISQGKPRQLFRSTEHLAPCPNIYDSKRVAHGIELSFDFGKPVMIAYHTEHIVSSTGKMCLHEGGDPESIVGLLHNKPDRFEIQPLVIGAPWFEHSRNGSDSCQLMWMGRDLGELLPEDIDQFSKMKDVRLSSAEEWLSVMKTLPEAKVKSAFASLLCEPTKNDWGGETNDHFSGSVAVRGQRKTAAFLLKGPTQFREMTLDLCGKRADQIYRLTLSGAQISIVQHCHMIGEAVRGTLRNLTVYPGRTRKYCLIDGQATYRILKAYSLL